MYGERLTSHVSGPLEIRDSFHSDDGYDRDTIFVSHVYQKRHHLNTHKTPMQSMTRTPTFFFHPSCSLRTCEMGRHNVTISLTTDKLECTKAIGTVFVHLTLCSPSHRTQVYRIGRQANMICGATMTVNKTSKMMTPHAMSLKRLHVNIDRKNNRKYILTNASMGRYSISAIQSKSIVLVISLKGTFQMSLPKP